MTRAMEKPGVSPVIPGGSSRVPSSPSEEYLFPRIIDSFQRAMRLRVHLVPGNEKRGKRSLNGDGHPFCKMIQSCPTGRKRCLKEISRAVHVSAKTGEPYIFQCHADMIEFTAALLDGGENISAFVCGPILLRHPDSFFEKDMLAKVEDLPLHPPLLMGTVTEIPVFSERRVQAAADLLFMIANYFSRMDPLSQMQQHEIARQQASLAEELMTSKKADPEVNELQSTRFQFKGEIHKEKELIDLIKFGDRKKAKALLDELLGTALFRSHEHIGILKARVLEIIFVIARAAVEAGANLEEILGFKYQCIQNLSRDDSQEALYYFLMNAFDHLFECIYQNRNIQHTKIFARAKEYIWSNYNQDISLKRLSEAVGMNPCYLSHLFRKEMGASFMEYLTSVRISVAKSLLKQTTKTVLDVCLDVGYQDPSHFAKVFKKKEGLQPTEYRNRTLDYRD